MKILIVGMADSIHTVRWISQMSREGLQVFLFPSIPERPIHRALQGATVFSTFFPQAEKSGRWRRYGIPTVFPRLTSYGKHFLNEFFPTFPISFLSFLVKRFKFDAVHSLEIQHAGYLTLAAKRKVGSRFPPWIVTPWGSDLFFFGRFAEHQQKIREVMENCDYCWCESHRDELLTREFGFRGEELPRVHATGGIQVEFCEQHNSLLPSHRRKILVKGYQSWAGRALVAIRALERCAPALKDFEVVLFSASPEVILAARLFSQSNGVPLHILPEGTSHEEVLRTMGSSRVVISLSITDGIPSTLLETMAMKAFPIQSATCAGALIVNGENGLLVPPEDPDIVAQAILKALGDRDLVDHAANRNFQIIQEQFNARFERGKISRGYRSLRKPFSSQRNE